MDGRRTEPETKFLGERYELLELCGSGGMAEVWRARDQRLDREVAVKVLSGAGARDPGRRRRIDREARVLASLSHPNIVPVYDYGEEAGPTDEITPYLVMELIGGADLHRHLEEHGRADPAEAVAILDGILAAIERAHEAGIVHGDLKPANVFMDAHGPKVGDFGVARILSEETGTTTVAATPTFAAPEVLRGGRPTPASDIYSVACLAFELLCGRPPYEGANAWEVTTKHLEAPLPSVRMHRSDVPAALDEAIRRGMQKDPRRRYASAAEFRAALVIPVADETAPLAAGAAATSGAPEPTEALAGRPDLGAVAILGPLAGVVRRGVDRAPELGRRLERWKWFPIAAAAVLGLVLLAIALSMRSPALAVPEVKGQDEAAALLTLRRAGLDVTGVSYAPITAGEPGKVIRTIPAAGERIEPGGDVHVIAGALAQPVASEEPPKEDHEGGGGGEGGEGGGKGKGKGKGDD